MNVSPTKEGVVGVQSPKIQIGMLQIQMSAGGIFQVSQVAIEISCVSPVELISRTSGLSITQGEMINPVLSFFERAQKRIVLFEPIGLKFLITK